jgi:hypothetical protein
MKYKFDQFKVEIENPTVIVKSVNDNLQAKTCSVDILLSVNFAEFGVNLSNFTYTTSWEDADIQAWVNTELQKYAV